ncbi:MAG: hypothetical protein EAZ89_02140 [Bacteroidetes bacterium]|nr:MAG: hypothetical protein EAZ89_02140 [Bacteroidota bacterium]
MLTVVAGGVLLALLFFALTQLLDHQYYTQNFDATEEVIGPAPCWAYKATDVLPVKHDGIYGAGACADPSDDQKPSVLRSPCTYFYGSGNLSFTHYLQGYTEKAKRNLTLVAVDPVNHAEKVLLSHVYTHSRLLYDTVAIALKGYYHLEWRWAGQKDAGKAWIDDIRIPGKYVSEPRTGCTCSKAAMSEEAAVLPY